jgi:dethiobiotin synthetase
VKLPADVLVVTGTGTDVGKTIVTAALASNFGACGVRVAVVKPAQTGAAPGEPGDLAEVQRLSGVRGTHEFARFPGPLSPEAAARVSGLPPLDLAAASDRVKQLSAEGDLVLVEGAGGLLVRYDPGGATLAGLAAALGAAVLVVTSAGLGTLNHTALTLEALAARRLPLAGVVIGSWPERPGLAERCNVADLAALAGGTLAGAVPAGAGRLGQAAFRRLAAESLAPHLGGRFDPAAFGDKYRDATHPHAKEPT